MKRYRSAIDWWVANLLIGSPLFCVGLGIYFLSSSFSAGILIILGGFVEALLIVLFLPCHYTLDDEHLLVRSGILKKKIQYKGIKKIEPSTCLLSAPAFSLKRIRIESEDGVILISPVNRDEFINLLKARSIHSEQ